MIFTTVAMSVAQEKNKKTTKSNGKAHERDE